MLHHHQGVAGIAQAQHGQVDAVHVTRVQANAGLIQHKQGVDQGGAQGRGQVDALHLTATQGAALPVQREVANADLAEVFQAGANFFHQQVQGLRIHVGHIHLHGFEELVQFVNGHQHQVVQAQAGHGFELRAVPRHALGHEALLGRHHRVSVVFAANAPQQAVGLQAGPATHAARRIAAVFGEQHTDVHLVRLALEVFKEALDAVPLVVPLALPQRRAVDHPILLCLTQLGPWRVARNAFGFGVTHQVVLALFPGGCLDGLDGAGAQGELLVGNDQAIVHPNHATKTTAGFTGTDRRVEREHRRHRIAVAQVAVGAMQAGGEAPHIKAGLSREIGVRARVLLRKIGV